MKKYIAAIIPALIIISCGQPEDPAVAKARQDSIDKANSRTLYLNAVDSARKKIDASKGFDSKLALEALKAYSDFIVTFPKDSMTPEFLFRASDLARGTGNFQQATVYLEQIIENHKGYPRYVEAMFMCANIYDESLENVNNGGERAKTLYQFIIDKYPDHPLAADAKVLIEYLGKPDSVLFNDIMKKAEGKK
ncbi:MAG: hypothetical protein Fur0041_20710 [Bacteroidia bacterium]